MNDPRGSVLASLFGTIFSVHRSVRVVIRALLRNLHLALMLRVYSESFGLLNYNRPCYAAVEKSTSTQ